VDVRKKIALALTGAALVAAVAPAASAGKPKTVWEDEEGDAFLGDATLGPVFAGAGLDLTGGTIRRDKENLEFTVTHASMPPSGSFPEGARFLWNITVDGEPFRFTVKSVDLGKPDVVAGQTTERVGRVDLQGHFRLEGECVTEPVGSVNAINCPPLAYLDGVFDPAAASFTITVPMELIGAKTKSKIVGGGGNICSICWVSHVAERSLDATIVDSAAQTTTYKVPKK
jgi:hypothetical protein